MRVQLLAKLIKIFNFVKVLDINSPAIVDENFSLSDGDKYINLTYAFNFEKFILKMYYMIMKILF